MWRDYREKRNRRAFYFLALLLVLLIVASSLPNSDSPVFGTGNTQNNSQTETNSGLGTPGEDGEDGVDGLNGLNGQDGEDGVDGLNGLNGQDGEDGVAGAAGQNGADGAPGSQGPAGPQGPAGANGSSSSSNNTANGQAVVSVGACDSDITVSLRSRLVGGVFYFKRITFSDIDARCLGSAIDVYLLDSSDDELASYIGGTISGSTFYFDYPVFELAGAPIDVPANDIDSVAIEIAE
jgi:hypothetical protein